MAREWVEMIQTAEEEMDGIYDALSQTRLLALKISRLTVKQFKAEEQMFYQAAQINKGHGLTLEQLDDLLGWARLFGARRWETRWAMSGLPSVRSVDAMCRARESMRPNGDHGSWSGEHVKAGPENPMPPDGRTVVYVLYDHQNEPCYVGSTEGFRARMRWHIKDGKPVARWVAYPCASRGDGYALEDRLLKEHKPYLNKRAGA